MTTRLPTLYSTPEATTCQWANEPSIVVAFGEEGFPGPYWDLPTGSYCDGSQKGRLNHFFREVAGFRASIRGTEESATTAGASKLLSTVVMATFPGNKAGECVSSTRNLENLPQKTKKGVTAI
jgi:hypothetical protein